ncbi:hypothetical protein YQE_00513, partial [Dendroctonus ponderosae]
MEVEAAQTGCLEDYLKQTVSGGASLIMACVCALLEESPRFYLKIGRNYLAYILLKQVYAINKSSFADTFQINLVFARLLMLDDASTERFPAGKFLLFVNGVYGKPVGSNDCCLLRHVFLSCSFSNNHLADQKCGRALGSDFSTASERIVAGYDVGYYRYPWYAALIQEKQVSCGGALIGPKLVITAAHCYKEYLELANKSAVKLENVYTVRLGLYNICTTEKTVTEYRVDKVQVHELYLTKKPYFDICLLTLANSTEAYEPLCLPSGGITQRPKEGTVPGMGTLKYQGPMPCTLHEARLLIHSDATCFKMINDTGNDGNDIKNAFCAGYLTGGIDSCQGDSGGPLQIRDRNGRFVLFGIVSFGFHCGLPKYLGVYTDASQYIDWIKENSQTDLDLISSMNNESSTEISSESHDESFEDSATVSCLLEDIKRSMQRNCLDAYPDDGNAQTVSDISKFNADVDFPELSDAIVKQMLPKCVAIMAAQIDSFQSVLDVMVDAYEQCLIKLCDKVSSAYREQE